jgi:hypothetical protein
MHNERCTSGLARGYAKPPAARPAWRAYPTQPWLPAAVKGQYYYWQGNRIKRPAFQAFEPDSVHRIRP